MLVAINFCSVMQASRMFVGLRMALEDGEFRHSWQSTAWLASNEMDVDALHSVLGRLKDDGTGVAATCHGAGLHRRLLPKNHCSQSPFGQLLSHLSSWPGFCTSKDDGPTWEIYAFAIEMFHTTASSTETDPTASSPSALCSSSVSEGLTFIILISSTEK